MRSRTPTNLVAFYMEQRQRRTSSEKTQTPIDVWNLDLNAIGEDTDTNINISSATDTLRVRGRKRSPAYQFPLTSLLEKTHTRKTHWQSSDSPPRITIRVIPRTPQWWSRSPTARKVGELIGESEIGAFNSSLYLSLSLFTLWRWSLSESINIMQKFIIIITYFKAL